MRRLTQIVTINRYQSDQENLEFQDWIEVAGIGQRAAFARSESGNILETVEFLNDGSSLPNWEEAGEVDINRGSNPGLITHLQELLEPSNYPEPKLRAVI